MMKHLLEFSIAKKLSFGKLAVGLPKRSMRLLATVATLLVSAVGLSSCTTNEVTGRSQLLLVGDSQMNTMGADAFSQIKKQKKTTNDPKYVKPVQEVASRIVQVSHSRGQSYEVVVFVDDTPNAFALPGNKIGVHTGLFKVAKNNAQLATVIGHEFAHVAAKHSAERMSQSMVAQLGVSVAGAAYGSGAANLLAQAATLGVILPFSRSQETEADEIGLIYMAKAGYDPRQSIPLWQNFAKEGGNRPPEFLSTHPSPGNRIENLQAMMPQAMAEYNKSPYK